jgi:hypothetical protein
MCRCGCITISWIKWVNASYTFHSTDVRRRLKIFMWERKSHVQAGPRIGREHDRNRRLTRDLKADRAGKQIRGAQLAWNLPPRQNSERERELSWRESVTTEKSQAAKQIGRRGSKIDIAENKSGRTKPTKPNRWVGAGTEKCFGFDSVGLRDRRALSCNQELVRSKSRTLSGTENRANKRKSSALEVERRRPQNEDRTSLAFFTGAERQRPGSIQNATRRSRAKNESVLWTSAQI